VNASQIVARQQLKDLFRNRQVWLSLLLQPILFVGLLGFFGWVGQQQSQAFRTKQFTADVTGNAADTRPFDEILRSSNFIVHHNKEIFADLRKSVGQAQVAVIVPAGAARDLDAGRTVNIRLYYDKGDNKSEVALGRVQGALDALAANAVSARLAERGLAKELFRPLSITTRDATSTDQGARLTLGNLLPVLVLLQSTSLLTTASGLLAGAKDKRTLEPLLLLPIRRSQILRGAGAAAFVMGLIPVAAFIVPVVAATLLPIGFAHGLSSIPIVVMGLVIVGPLLAALMVGIGLLMGTISRGSESGSALGNFAFLPFMAIGFFFVFVSSPPSGLGMYAIPAYGPALLMRTIVGHGFALVPFLIVVASTAVYATTLLRLATTYLETERAVLRPSG
jgi:sodium transport system permease protein